MELGRLPWVDPLAASVETVTIEDNGQTPLWAETVERYVSPKQGEGPHTL